MRHDSLGLFWEDIKEEKVRKADLGPDISKLVKVPEKGLGFAPVIFTPTTKVYGEVKYPVAFMDIEIYQNYFLVMFQALKDGATTYFEKKDGVEFDSQGVLDMIDKFKIVTFNGDHYDLPILRYALTGVSTQEIKAASDDIIYQDLPAYQFEQKYETASFEINHIDLIELAPGQVSLKTYGGRLHVKHLEDLPYEHDTVLEPEQMDKVRAYCAKDLDDTKHLFLELLPQIQLRETMSDRYRIDLRSKSDAQIAEAVISSEIQKKTGRRIPKIQVRQKDFCYERPDFIKTKNAYLRDAIAIVTSDPFTVTKDGRPKMPKRLEDLQIKIGSTVYQMGMGGLHSTERCQHFVENDEYIIADWDVASYYPSIILGCGLYPPQLGETFLEVYRAIVEERLAAKASGDKVKAEALKITINGSFGKLGSPYSVLYAPELMVQVTVTGQLSLLMLIDELEHAGISVVSANTDGIVCYCKRELEGIMSNIIQKWMEVTGFEMEESRYKGIFSRDVNNYIAIKHDGKAKTKGCFGSATLQKNPQNEVCNLAIIELLKSGTPVMDTITGCFDITKFITVRNVKGGAVKGGEYLGKVVRWYYGTGEKGTINHKKGGNLVPKTQGAVPIMDLPDKFPDNVDYRWYEKECISMLYGLGLKL